MVYWIEKVNDLLEYHKNITPDSVYPVSIFEFPLIILSFYFWKFKMSFKILFKKTKKVRVCYGKN